MSVDHTFSINTGASRQQLRDVLVRAEIGLEPEPDWKDISCAISVATDVSVGNLDHRWRRPDNGVRATRWVIFGDRKAHHEHPGEGESFERQTVLGVMALLKAFPDANAFFEINGADFPMLLRRGGALVVAEGDRFWNDKLLDLVDLPHVVAPLGPWPRVDL